LIWPEYYGRGSSMASKRLKGIYKYSDSRNWWFRYTDPIPGSAKP
jgi:hypothetical protein